MSEIDELLNTLKTSSLEPHEEYTMQFTNREQKILLDYITSLEKGLEYAKRIEKDYKTKFDKAIEFIEEELTFYITIGGTDERKLIGYNKAFDELLKILQGSDKE